MQNILLSSIVILCYFLAGGFQGARLSGRLGSHKLFVALFALIAISIHALLLYQWIDTGNGQNLTFFNMLSQVAWIIAVLILLLMGCKPLKALGVENLGVIIFPWAAVTIILALAFPGAHIIDTGANPKQLAHILLSFFALSIFFIAATQAVFLAIQDGLLHRHRSSPLLSALPPLESMEKLLFQMITIGFWVLSFVVLTTIFFLPAGFKSDMYQHAVLAMLAWFVFAVLLWGHKYLGWRGRTAIRWTLSGLCLLLFSYFGCRMLLTFMV